MSSDPAAGAKRTLRLETRLTLVATSLVLVVAGTIAFLFHRLSIGAVEEARLQTAIEIAESIALRLGAGVPSKAVLERIASEYVHANSAVVAASVHVVTPEGGTETLSAVGMRMEHEAEQEQALAIEGSVWRIVEQHDERFWSVAVPIRTEGRVVGVVGTWSTLQASELITRQNQRLALVVLPASVAVLALLLSFAFRRLVQRPLTSLREAMIRAELGDLTADAPVARRDEIGFITGQYNQMLARIRGTQEEREGLLRRVQGFNEELSKTVEGATAELKDRNSMLQRLNQDLFYLQERLVRIERQSVAQQMTARVAHKIGTPLNLISGHVQMLQRTRRDDNELHEKLSLIQSQIDKLTRTVREILDETRASFRMEAVDLNRFLEGIGALLKPTLSARGVELSLRLESRAARVDADEAQLEQVFLTVINNSLDAMPNGGQLVIGTKDAPGTVRVTLRDDGEGMPPEVLAQIFRPFFSTKRPGRGTGLGLSIVRELLAAHRASFNVDSSVGGGTVVTIEFPVVEIETAGPEA